MKNYQQTHDIQWTYDSTALVNKARNYKSSYYVQYDRFANLRNGKIDIRT